MPFHTIYSSVTSREGNQVIFLKEPQFKVSLLFSSRNHSHPSDPQPNALTVIKKAVYTRLTKEAKGLGRFYKTMNYKRALTKG